MGTNTPHTCIPGLVWEKQARRCSQFELKVGKLGFPIHFVCVSAALYHRGVRGRHFPLRWIWPIHVNLVQAVASCDSFLARRQELPLSGGNGNPTSGYEANERCAADHGTRPAAHRVDHTSISELQRQMICNCGAVTITHSCSALHSVNVACIDQHVDQSMFHCLLCGVWISTVCACMCVDCIDVCFESDRLPAKKDFTRWKPVQLASETYDNTPHSPCSSTSKLLEDHKCFFC